MDLNLQRSSEFVLIILQMSQQSFVCVHQTFTDKCFWTQARAAFAEYLKMKSGPAPTLLGQQLLTVNKQTKPAVWFQIQNLNVTFRRCPAAAPKFQIPQLILICESEWWSSLKDRSSTKQRDPSRVNICKRYRGRQRVAPPWLASFLLIRISSCHWNGSAILRKWGLARSGLNSAPKLNLGKKDLRCSIRRPERPIEKPPKTQHVMGPFHDQKEWKDVSHLNRKSLFVPRLLHHSELSIHCFNGRFELPSDQRAGDV